MFSLIIKNVMIADGTGKNKLYRASVGIENGYIKTIQKDIPTRLGRKIYNAQGLVLAPGFIDIHGHSDISILAAPEASSKICQGITTEICGNCGLSVFPLTNLNKEHIKEIYKRYNVDIFWNTFCEYAKEVQNIEPGINILSLCGHNTLKAAVYGYEKTDFSLKKLNQQIELLSQSLFAGAFGLSLGLLYVPGIFADEKEIKALLKTTAKTKMMIAAHLRNEGDSIKKSLLEFLHLTSSVNCRKTHISHLKIAGKQNWHKIDDILEMLKNAKANLPINTSITADRYPYTESMTQLSVFMLPPYSEMDDESLTNLLQDKNKYDKFILSLSSKVSSDRWDNLRLISSESSFLRDSTVSLSEIYGNSISKISKLFKISPSVLCANILRDDASGTTVSSSGMSYDNMLKILLQPYVCCSTDETARPHNFSIGRSHPRGFGSFPKLIQLLTPLIGIEAVIRKMTSLPAYICGLQNRGLIAPGFAADLVLLDIEKILNPSKQANFINPHQTPDGIEKVWVNGKLSYDQHSTITTRNGIMIANIK